MKCELYQFYPVSYLNGWIGRKGEEVKIGIAEDKLIWESK